MEIEENIHSEEIEEIMERMPKKFLKWGSSAVVLLIILLVILSSIVEYPDTINGTVLLTTKSPPTSINAFTTGIIDELFVEDKELVEADETLAVLKSRTNYEAVLLIDSILSHAELLGNDNSNVLSYTFWMKQKTKLENLGNVTYPFSSFLKTLKEFDLENKKQTPLDEILADITNEDLYDKAWAVITQKERLMTSISLWKDRYLLKSITKGKVSFQTFWSKNQVINSRQEFCKVISSDSDIVCVVQIPTNGAAKVKKLQNVRIVLTSYPENEFGFLEGKVANISDVPSTNPSGSYYTVTVNVKTPLVSSMHLQIEYLPEMQGTAEIITEKKTILDRLLSSFLNYWNKK